MFWSDLFWSELQMLKEAKVLLKFKKYYLLKNDKDLAQVNSNAKLYKDDLILMKKIGFIFQN